MSTEYCKTKLSTSGHFESLKINTLSCKVACHAIHENQKVDMPENNDKLDCQTLSYAQ